MPIPRLPAGDPRNELSDAARRRIDAALREGDQRIDSAIDEASVTGRDVGDAELDRKLDKAHMALSVTKREFEAIGKRGAELRRIMSDEIDACSSGLELSDLQRRLLEHEFLG